ncbi:short-chain dehydrogenase [Actinoplanes cyaneus]|uniref:Short-chain dehydrogenase n=1 Tax=Actinoplanes cyaneus TaxID=52696 RepID=A0A919MG54_9ACTN|nr:SDR family oxidoreductase [Actinoplanes cyaneus]MCW2139721.1 NAD(P)-dependent dehydrogenase, short-chain alcohol dehydrogenase family [Actinoplanes cyaneus]GID69876.1 short-chain dehydrogenase [Actinoplanes cyaneus]
MSKRILVVGGTSGVGLATARRLAAAGNTVHVASRDTTKLTDAPELEAHQADGNDAAAVARLAAGLAPLDTLVVTLSGAEGAGAFAELDLASLRRAFEGKFWPTLTVLQAVLPHLAERASITLVGAISAHAAMPGTAGIGSLNAAVESLVRPLAVELAPRRINAVSPGLVDTPWWNGLAEPDRTAWFASAAKVLPVGRVSTADEIADAVVLAATNPSMTGSILHIDGGARFAHF